MIAVALLRVGYGYTAISALGDIVVGSCVIWLHPRSENPHFHYSRIESCQCWYHFCIWADPPDYCSIFILRFTHYCIYFLPCIAIPVYWSHAGFFIFFFFLSFFFFFFSPSSSPSPPLFVFHFPLQAVIFSMGKLMQFTIRVTSAEALRYFSVVPILLLKIHSANLFYTFKFRNLFFCVFTDPMAAWRLMCSSEWPKRC